MKKIAIAFIVALFAGSLVYAQEVKPGADVTKPVAPVTMKKVKPAVKKAAHKKVKETKEMKEMKDTAKEVVKN